MQKYLNYSQDIRNAECITLCEGRRIETITMKLEKNKILPLLQNFNKY
jgi:hypothetical protein